MSKDFVAILMGSDSDLPTMQKTYDTLKELGVEVEMKITSAHRTPVQTKEYVNDAEARGCKVFICAAGLAAHLAGAVAGMTVKPVIGVPMAGGPLNGQDSLLSTVMMPGGVPVATVAVGSAGAKNAAYLAGQIMALTDETIAKAVADDRVANRDKVIAKDADLQAKLNG
ncbi:5-(carboxyamino)imidazole ribonucleotide mutase [Kangiella shandongensis]|uniref:5-(carboxyamino)imidazole ribonucleotide mutase n=1 Tax=Kangiella shandongensis TaxID=2763258 RepID=UPI001CC11E15|nr:5-(carboxyamino)imidazole ribonucleotide mutase [Kangiella shandongensis]